MHKPQMLLFFGLIAATQVSFAEEPATKSQTLAMANQTSSATAASMDNKKTDATNNTENKDSDAASDDSSAVDDSGDDDMDFSDIPDGSSNTNISQGLYIGVGGGVGMDHWSRYQDRPLPYRYWTNIPVSKIKHRYQPSLQLILGYSFNQNFSLEANAFYMPDNQLQLQNTASKIDITHWNADLVGRMGILFSKTYFYFKLGGGYMHENFSHLLDNCHQWVPVLGVGDIFIINKNLALGLDYTHFMNVDSQKNKHYMPSQDYLMLRLQINFSI